MSGHSKWSQIKHKKALTDAKKGKIFSKLAKVISLIAKNDGNIETNPSLRMAVEKAKSVNMPAENIERAIKKGSGEIEGAKMEEVIYEVYGPGGSALILEGITDNKNRTIAEIKHILTRCNGKLAETGSVNWLFNKKGVLEIQMSENKNKTKDDLELIIIESGADDFEWLQDDTLIIYTSTDKLEETKKYLENRQIKINSSALDLIPKNPINIDDPKIKEQFNKLFEALDEHDDINEIYSNLKE